MSLLVVVTLSGEDDIALTAVGAILLRSYMHRALICFINLIMHCDSNGLKQRDGTVTC